MYFSFQTRGVSAHGGAGLGGGGGGTRKMENGRMVERIGNSLQKTKAEPVIVLRYIYGYEEKNNPSGLPSSNHFRVEVLLIFQSRVKVSKTQTGGCC